MKKHIPLLSLAAAIAALPTTSDAARTPDVAPESNESHRSGVSRIIPNQIVVSGDDLLGFLVTRAEDGTVVAQHSSHVSHSSHSSHRSHYSSR
ncbi:His-Xaa-Ser repeat protein HxsA2 [Pararoseomonas sp. SCSIO 73927]|uniref:His-Xaa-Ser repeat protein HxsA2 n=1 Tax=Pararoseomonas sp. SCSIO 73927 TaxID=3114537 RepID=UPI0038D051D2